MLIIRCDKCDRKMGTLERYMIIADKYLCLTCAESANKDQEAQAQADRIQQVYDNLDDTAISWIGFYKLPAYNAFKKHGYIFLGTGSRDNLKQGLILVSPEATPDETYDVFIRHGGLVIKANPSKWSIGVGYADFRLTYTLFSDSEIDAILPYAPLLQPNATLVP